MAGDINSAAAIYAESLLDLAHEAGKAEEIGQELADVRELWRKQPGFAAMMTSAAIDEDSRRESLRKMFSGRVHQLVLNLMLVLNDKRRSSILPAVIDAYRGRLDRLMNRMAVFVTAPIGLNDEQRQRISAEVKRLTGSEARLVEKTDPEVLSGLIVQVGDRVYDYSGRRRLREMKRSLKDAVHKHLLAGTGKFVRE